MVVMFCCQDVIDEWLACQRSWLYLEPIFSSDDINRQLPVESKRYQTMERLWRKVMKMANENPQVSRTFVWKVIAMLTNFCCGILKLCRYQ